ncbi:CMRF35-like molecule 6 [Clarias gariepinus]|uniref:CMRF35-like molecule 6 n=1 Tax=Clarias gariepinus TaxID=13013 RepID=UPI00234DBE2C|nr:CMRF35-like molecule 6 [Clarias gariepinus]
MCECELRMKILLIFTLCLISDLSYQKSISETVHVGGDLNFSCKYPESLRSNPKFLCNTRLQASVCFYKKSLNESEKHVNVGKFSLYDDRERQTLSVSIKNVTERDSGKYWCGAEAAWESDDGYEVYFTQINLTVTDPHVPVSTWKSTQPSSSSSSSSSPFGLLSASPPAGFRASTVIPVSVTLALLLIGVIFLIVVLQKRRRMQGEIYFIGSSDQDGGNNREWVKYTRSSSASDEGTSADYCNMRPTIPSDPSQSIYANVM